MQKGIVTKPRYKIVTKVSSKIWLYKNSYVRRFYERRARRVQRRSLFKLYVLVAKNRKWSKARRYIKPDSRLIGRKIQGGKKTRKRRPIKQTYKRAFYQKQKLRQFYGNIKESDFVALFRKNRKNQSKRSQSFFSKLESRLERIVYRRRLLPTIYACQQRIKHQGVYVNEKLQKSPQTDVVIGDIVSRGNLVWKQVYWELFFRAFYRRWGFFVFSRRFYKRFKKKIFISFKKKRWTKNKRLKYSKKRKKRWVAKVRRGRWNKRFVYVQKNPSNLSSVKSLRSINHDKTKLGFNKAIKNKKQNATIKARIFDNLGQRRNQATLENNISVASSMIEQKKQQLLKIFYAKKMKRYLLPRFKKKRKNETSIVWASVKRKKANKINHRGESWSKRKRRRRSATKLAYWDRRKNKQKNKLVRRIKRIRRRFGKYRRRWRKRIIRKRKHPRLKGIHRYIPKYLQVNFRTIQIIKIATPDPKDIYTGFRVSAAKIYSFFISRGF